METLETVFDINRILVTLFNTSEEIRKEKNIDLVYETDANIPKELRGDSAILLRLWTKLFTFIFKNSDRNEIVFTLSAPEDFLYEEDISFRIKETGISKEKVLAYMETELSKDLEYLEGKIVYKDEDFSDVSLNIPFKINELGFRRNYRLPSENMLDKRVLIICQSDKISHSIKKLFQYFHYNVDVGLEIFKEKGSDLGRYDIFLTEENLATGEVGHIIRDAEELDSLRLVILKGKEKVQNSSIQLISSYLSKPVTQESIYNLIVKLFDPEFENILRVKKEKLKSQLKPNVEKKFAVKDELQNTIEEKKSKRYKVLDVQIGQSNAQKQGLVYHHELEHFVKTFDRSDLYFRQIVQEKATNKIKEFCIDLERQSKVIGAESMLSFANTISLIFIHDKLDMLPIYPGRYHLELQKLMEEIKKQI